MRIYGSDQLTWKGNQLFVMGRRAPMAEVVRDRTYPIMWRFRFLPDGPLSDMANLTRAKDAARCHVLRALNGEGPGHGSARIDETPSLAPEAGPDVETLCGAPISR